MPKFAANLSMLFTEAPFLERFALARQHGFEGVEYLFPYTHDANELASRLAENGLTQVLHNLPAGDWEKGERGIACLPGREGEFREGVATAIAYAQKLGCTQVNCLAGIATEGAEAAELNAVLTGNLAYAAGELDKVGIRLLIEPVNTRDIPGFFISRTAQARQIIAEVGSDNLFVQYDIYHMQIMEGDLARTLEANLDRIAHLQLADNPGRHEPGTGEINYDYLFGAIDRMGYGGWIGCEYVPKSGTAEGLGWLKNARA